MNDGLYYIAIEHGHSYIVSFPIGSMMIFHSELKLPAGKQHTVNAPRSLHQWIGMVNNEWLIGLVSWSHSSNIQYVYIYIYWNDE